MIEELRLSYFDALFDTNEEMTNKVIEKALDNDIDKEKIVFEIIIPNIEKTTDFYLNNEIPLSQHFLMSKISDSNISRLLSIFEKNIDYLGLVVIGTAFGDFHGLGKKIVTGCLKARMFKVIDLGLNVHPEKFVDTAIKNKAQFIAVSSMMVHTALGQNGPKKIKKILETKGLTEKIKLIVGGAPYKFEEELYKEVGADFYAKNGIEAANIIKKTVREVK